MKILVCGANDIHFILDLCFYLFVLLDLLDLLDLLVIFHLICIKFYF